MLKLNEIASELRALLLPEFLTVRISAGRDSGQVGFELQSMHPDRLPGVIVAFDRFGMTDGGVVRESRFSLILVDRFIAGNEAKALSLFEGCERLCGLFPPHGRERRGVTFFPAGCTAAEGGGEYACMIFEVLAKQGIQ